MRFGLVGAGTNGKRRAQAVKQLGAELVLVADIDYGRTKSLAEEMRCQATKDWQEVVARDDIDIVLVCTPPDLHAEASIAAMRQNKHVLCEKPLGRNPEEAKKVLDTAQETGMKLKCGLNYRHHMNMQQARSWFEEGLIGEVTFIRCRYGIGGEPGYEKNWRMDAKISGGGQLMDQGIQPIDLSRWFMGDPCEVTGFLTTSFWDIAPLEDNAFVLLRTAKGQVASIHVSWTHWKNIFSLEIFGKDGYIIVDGLGGSYGTERAILGKRAFLKPFREEVIEFRRPDQSWVRELKELSDAIAENRQPMGNGYDGWQAVKLAYAVYESTQKKAVVRVK